MPTTDALQQQINALTQRVDAITAPPTNYYTHRYSGEEIDNGVQGGLLLGIPSSKQQALRNIGGRPNRNLLDNWYFVGGGSQQGGELLPINQQGQVSYSANGMTIDRWPLAVSTGNYSVTLEGDGLSFVFDAGTTIFSQRIPDNVWNEMLGKTVTISILDGTGLHTNTVDIPEALPVDTGNVNFGNNMTSDIFASSGAPPQFRIYNFNGLAASAKIRAAKLELGPTQTLAYQDEDGNWQLFETPSFQEEQAKCQRYLWKSPSPNGFSILGYAIASSQTMAYLLIELPVSLRDGITPSLSTINFPNLVFIGTNGLEALAHSWMIDDASAGDKVLIQCRGTFIAGQTYLVLLTNGDTLSVSAEL